MEKKRRPIWLRILLWLLGIVGGFALTVGAFCAFLYFKYEIILVILFFVSFGVFILYNISY